MKSRQKSFIQGFIKNKFPYILVVFFIFVTLFTIFARRHSGHGPSGDEPNYLVMSMSILKDHDLDIKNDFISKRYVGYVYYNDSLEPHYNHAIFSEKSPHWYSIHTPGLAILMVPFFAIKTVEGAAFGMSLFATLALILTYLWAKRVLLNRYLAFLVTIIMFSSIFYLGLAGSVYPDIIITCMLLLAMLIIERDKQPAWMLMILGSLVGLSFFIHIKAILSFAIIGLVAVYKIVKNDKKSIVKIRNFIALAAPAFLLIIIFELKLHQWYGIWIPSEMYKGTGQLFSVNPARAIAAIIFDNNKGLIINNPAFLLIIAGLPIWFVKNKKQLLRLLLIILPPFFLQATFNDWAGGYSPPGRYIMEFLPLFLPAIGFFIIFAKNKFAMLITWLLVIIQASLGLIYVFGRIGLNYAGERSLLFTKIQEKFGIALDRLFPHFSYQLTLQKRIYLVWLGLWLLICAAFLLYGIMISKQVKNNSKN